METRNNLSFNNYSGLFSAECFDDTSSARGFVNYLINHQIRFAVLTHEKEPIVSGSLMGEEQASLMTIPAPIIVVRNREMIDSVGDFELFRKFIGFAFKDLASVSPILTPRGGLQ